MNGDEHYIFILKHQFQNLLRSIAIRYTHQTGKTPDTMIGMYHIIPRSKLVQFF